MNTPAHYAKGPEDPYEVIKITEHFALNANLMNCLKYVLRAGKKDDRRQDLLKGLNYLHREIFGTWFPKEADHG